MPEISGLHFKFLKIHTYLLALHTAGSQKDKVLGIIPPSREAYLQIVIGQ